MVRNIVFYENHFIEFYKKQDHHVKAKIQYTFELIETVERVPGKFLKHVTGTDGLYEIRVGYRSNIYRIFCCFDEGHLVVLFNAFNKKTQKTPRTHIRRAIQLMGQYFEDKNQTK